MKFTKENIIAGLGFAALTGTVGFLVSTNDSLNSQVNSLQAELESLKLQGNNRNLQEHQDNLQGFFEKGRRDLGLGKRSLLDDSRLNVDKKEHNSLHNRGFEDITGFDPTAEHASEVANNNRHGRSLEQEQSNHRRLKGGKGGKGKKSSSSTARTGCSSGGKGKGKSKKSGGDDCVVEEVARQPAPEPEIITIFKEASCDQLRGVVSELTTKIDDLTEETLRFSTLTDDLQQTAYVAETGDTSRRFLENTEVGEVDAELAANLEDSLAVLDAQRDVLATGNGRMSSLNSVLRESTLLWISKNADLSDSNKALEADVDELSEAKALLEAERSRLSEQIADLTSLVNDLNEGIDVHKELNGELNASTAELERQIERLEASNTEYKRLNGELNATVTELEAQNTELAKQNEIFANLNQNLNVTAQKLEDQVDRLEDEVTDLTSQNDRLEGLVDDLESETDRLEATKDDLEETVSDLQTQVSRLDGQIDELKEVNAELGTISSFLNETAGNLDETYESMTQFLSEQILAYRAVATETLQNTYLQRVASWDCAYRDYFREFPFATDENAEIPKGDEFDQVVEYIDSHILSDLCLSKDDFLDFLEHEFDDPVFTSNHFVSGVNGYTLLAFDYYFPDDGEIGLTDTDWAMVGYDCSKLPDSKLFIYE